MNRFYQLIQYIKHLFTARNTKGFGVHSPFLFHFTTNIIRGEHAYYCFRDIEKVRKTLLECTDIIDKKDYGTGRSKRLKVSSIARTSLGTSRELQLLYRIINQYKFKQVLELGTSLGISTAYMASVNSTLKCISIEGCKQTAEIAKQTFNQLNLNNIDLLVGNIDEKLPQVLTSSDKIDFVYMDANHTQEATCRYFELILPRLSENAIVVIDDIYWSKDMQQGWQKICAHQAVTSTINLFQFGIVFVKPDLHKKHYKMRF